MSKSQIKISNFDPQGVFAGLVLPLRFRHVQKKTRFKQEWRLTLAQYAQMMGEFKGSRCQRGTIMLMGGGMMIGSASGFVVVNAHVFTAIVNGPVTSGVRFEQDGELHKIDSAAGDVQQDGEWWSDEPEPSIGDNFAARHLSAGKIGTYSNEAASANTWITITASRIWDVDSPLDDTKSCDATFEVGPQPSGPADDSGFIELTATDLGL